MVSPGSFKGRPAISQIRRICERIGRRSAVAHLEGRPGGVL